MRLSTTLRRPAAVLSLATASLLLVAGCSSADNEGAVKSNGGRVLSGSEVSTEGSSGQDNEEVTGEDAPVEGTSPGETSAESAFPSPDEFAEEIELAKEMTVEELDEYLDAKEQEVLADYEVATKAETEEVQERMEEVSTAYGNDRNDLADEYAQAIEDTGEIVETEVLLAIEEEFSARRLELDTQFEEESLKIQQWFDEATKDAQVEFAPRFLEAEARAYYMRQAQEGKN